MLRNYAHTFVGITLSLDQGERIIASIRGPVPKEARDALKLPIGEWVSWDIAPSFRLFKAQVDRIDKLLDTPCQPPELAAAFRELRVRMQDELESVMFFRVDDGRARFYTPLNLFSGAIAKMPSISDDIECAGQCIALQQGTAAVFHLMRAMEVAVQALSTKLSITNVDREWGKLLSDLHKEIEALPKGTVRDEWSEAHANLYHVKQAWRNNVMHPKQSYSVEQAEEVFNAVRVFMNQLAGLI